MLSVDGHADAAVEARIRIGWNKFRQLVPLLTNRDISLIRRGRLYIKVVCKVVCFTEVRPGLSGKKMRWHFSEQRCDRLKFGSVYRPNNRILGMPLPRHVHGSLD